MESSIDKEWAQKYLLDPLTAPEPSQIHAHELRESQIQYNKPTPRKNSGGDKNSRSSRDPYTPPSSASPTSSSFHPSNPFSPGYSNSKASNSPRTPRIHVDRSASGDSHSSSGSINNSRSRPPSYQTTADSEHHHRSRPRASTGQHNHRQAFTQNANLPQRSASNGQNHQRHQRISSLPQRFPGDMSHRPLDMIKAEAKAADRHPHHRSSHRRHRSAASQTDTIDALDTIGGTYHHGGPYDATLASRNLDEKYSPLAAVRDSNMEAIRATPREYIEDSLQKHVPLQGTATVPSGGVDFSGKRMEYAEGADLMREADAPGGAYKRYEGIQYHPDDLKGKGEPSFTIERDLKKNKQRDELLLHPDGGIEMTSPARQRSYSNSDVAGTASGSGIGRSNTTGKKLSDGLKKRFSIRRKKNAPVEGVH